MSIEVQHEDTSSLSAWGIGLEEVQERCFFCRVPTRYWYMPKNEPCCRSCAALKDAADFEGGTK